MTNSDLMHLLFPHGQAGPTHRPRVGMTTAASLPEVGLVMAHAVPLSHDLPPQPSPLTRPLKGVRQYPNIVDESDDQDVGVAVNANSKKEPPVTDFATSFDDTNAVRCVCVGWMGRGGDICTYSILL